MRNFLIVHPEDSSTGFLKGIYSNINDKTVITCGIATAGLIKLIDQYERVIMCGHGSPSGLFSVGQFPDSGSYIIDESMVQSLRSKTDCIFIWCDADQFVNSYNLQGIYSGMFVSEVYEAEYCQLKGINQEMVDESSYAFSFIVSKYINENNDILYKKVMHEYGLLARTNPVACYNQNRFYLNK